MALKIASRWAAGSLLVDGEVKFHNLITAYLVAHPPGHPSITEASRHLAEFASNSPLLGERPFIADLIGLERALVDVFLGPDAEPLGFQTSRAAAQNPSAPSPTARNRCDHSAPLEFAQHRLPALGALPIAVLHLPGLRPLYQEVARVTKSRGYFVIVGFHPQFLMAGMPTHFDRAAGEPVTIRSYVHLLSDHVKAAHAVGWSLLEMDEGLIDDAWLRKKPKWEGYFGLPISFSMVWRQQ